MPKDVVDDLPKLSKDMAYPAQFDMENYDDSYPVKVIKVAHPIAEAFEIAKMHWRDEGGAFTPLECGASLQVWPELEKFVIDQ